MQVLSGAKEGNAYVVTASFYDENNVAVVPTQVTWTLTLRDGTVVNNRLNVVTTPASTVNILLDQNDLAVVGDPWRMFKLNGLYDGSYGTGLPIEGEYIFKIRSDS